MTESRALATTNQSASLEVAGTVELNLDKFPVEKFNRIIPTQTLVMSDLFMPVPQVVYLDPAGSDGKSPDHYKSSDVPQGHRALTARGLNKLATAAGVSFYDERRIDDGSDPDVIGVSVMASMVLPTGQRITAPGSQLIDIRTWFGSSTSAAELAKFRKQFYAHVATRARNRAIRGLLSLRASYPERDIAKPFACVQFVPNANHPAVQQAMLAAMAGSIPALYGSQPQVQAQHAPALAAGPAVIEAPEIAEDDEIEGTAIEAGDDPSWFAEAAAEEAEDTRPRLVRLLVDQARESQLKGAMTIEQRGPIGQVFRAMGPDSVAAGLERIWGIHKVGDRLPVSAAQAEAIVTVHTSLGDEEFAALWGELVAKAA